MKVVRGKDGRVEYSKYAGCLMMLKWLAIAAVVLFLVVKGLEKLGVV